MPDWLPAAVAVAVITFVGTLVGIAMTRRTAKETNEINEADSLIKNLSAEVQRQDERLDRLDERVQRQDNTITQQGTQIRQLEANEWSLRRYVHKLIDKIRALGHDPPEPPRDLNL